MFHLAQAEVRERLEKATRHDGRATPRRCSDAIGSLFEHFVEQGCRACAISLPPDFSPTKVSADCCRSCSSGRDANRPRRLVHRISAIVATSCSGRWPSSAPSIRLPFDLMIGVNRGVYRGGVYQGQDLYDSRVSLIQYRELFNAFPQVTFPISVLASVTNQELVSYAWIFPNVVTNGHWWYSNTPTYIEHDAAAGWKPCRGPSRSATTATCTSWNSPCRNFAMYKRILAKVLAERFVIDRGWSEDRAVDFGREVLRGNVERIFFGANA